MKLASKKLAVVLVALCFSSAVPSQAAESDWIRTTGTEADWCWAIYGDEEEVDEVNVVESGALCDEWDDTIVDDGYDGFGNISGESSFTRTIQNNSVEWIALADSSTTLTIDGNMGSDGGTRYVTKNGLLISYQMRDRIEDLNPYYDPIFVWETNGTVTYADRDDDPSVSITGTRLSLKHYVYGFRNDLSLTADEFLDLFVTFVAENKDRMDIFTTSFSAGKDRAFWNSVENCRLSMARSLSAGSDVSTSTYQSCFFTGVNSSNAAAVNAALKDMLAKAAASGTAMSHADLMKAAAQIADRLDLIQRLSTGKLVYAAEFAEVGIDLGRNPTRTLDTLQGMESKDIDTLDELLAQIRKVA